MDIKLSLGQYFHICMSVDIYKPGQKFKPCNLKKLQENPRKFQELTQFFFSRINVETIIMNLFTYITCVNSHW